MWVGTFYIYIYIYMCIYIQFSVYFYYTFCLGIGYKTTKHLERLGVRNVCELQAFPSAVLEKELGVSVAQRIQKLSYGEDDSPVTPSGPPQVQVLYRNTFYKEQEKWLLVLCSFAGLTKTVHSCMYSLVQL